MAHGAKGGTRPHGVRKQAHGVRRYEGTKVRGYEGTRVRRYEGTKVRGYEGTGVRRYGGTKVRGVQEYERHGVPTMGIERFEELHAWQEGRRLARKGSIDNLTKQIAMRRRD